MAQSQTELQYGFIRSEIYPGEEVIILEQEIEIMLAKPVKTKSEMVAVEYYKQLQKVFNYIDTRIDQVEDLHFTIPHRREAIIKELNKIKNRCNP